MKLQFLGTQGTVLLSKRLYVVRHIESRILHKTSIYFTIADLLSEPLKFISTILFDKLTNDHAASLKFGSLWMSNTLSSVTKMDDNHTRGPGIDASMVLYAQIFDQIWANNR